MGKKSYLILATAFTIITSGGIYLVLAHTRDVNAGAAIIPALIAIIFIRLYQKSSKDSH